MEGEGVWDLEMKLWVPFSEELFFFKIDFKHSDSDVCKFEATISLLACSILKHTLGTLETFKNSIFQNLEERIEDFSFIYLILYLQSIKITVHRLIYID